MRSGWIASCHSLRGSYGKVVYPFHRRLHSIDLFEMVLKNALRTAVIEDVIDD